MPNQPKTPVRGVRLPDSLWKTLSDEARAESVAPSDVMRERLESPPPGGHTCQHVSYWLTCEAFDALMSRAEGACELCRARPQRPLHIDHNHAAGQGAVRGLLCAKCNAHMRRIDSGERAISDAAISYLDNAWYLSHPPTPRRQRQAKNGTIFRTIRIDDDLWRAALARAEERGETVSDLIRRALKRYVR